MESTVGSDPEPAPPVAGKPAIQEEMVGADGFEPPTSWSQTRRSTRLSYAPKPP